MLVVGAIGNAVLAAVVPVLTGNAFNAMLKPKPDTSVLLPLALTIGISQIVRGVLQLGRNFGAELMAQKMERDIRDELYLSLLGKSMTFHSLQPVGDTMARATNDVREINYMFSPGINLVVGSFLFLVVASVIICHRLETSRIGRAWMAIREDEIAAKAMGINTRNIKLLAFAMGASFGGIAGGLALSRPDEMAWAHEAGLVEDAPGDRVRLTLRGRLLSNELFARLV